MSEYDGPAFNKKARKNINERRFNRMTESGGIKRTFNPQSKRESLTNEEALHYELPSKLKQMDQLEDLAPPINKKHLDRRIEQAQANKAEQNPHHYTVPFLDKKENNGQDRLFLQEGNQTSEIEPSNQSSPASLNAQGRGLLSAKYQPALETAKQQEQPTHQDGWSDDQGETDHDDIGSSISNQKRHAALNQDEFSHDGHHDSARAQSNANRLNDGYEMEAKTEFFNRQTDSSAIDNFNQHQGKGKSIDQALIRQVAKRLVKDKTNYLLFEQSKEN